MQKNTHKTALITGAARRIGAEIATLLHSAEINVVIHYNTSKKEAEELCATLNKKRAHSAVTLQADLNDTTQCTKLIHDSIQSWGYLDILINSASRFYKASVGDVTESIWEDLINSNLRAPFFLSQAAAGELAKQQGCIVNIADIHAERPMRDYAVYCISKAGLVMMTKSLAKQLAPAVRVNAISPGEIIWPEGDNVLSDEEKNKILKKISLTRIGSPIEIAKTVLFLIRDASYITGQVITVDGGRSLGS